MAPKKFLPAGIRRRIVVSVIGLSLWLSAAPTLSGQRRDPVGPAIYQSKELKSDSKASPRLAPPSATGELAGPVELSLGPLSEMELKSLHQEFGRRLIGIHRSVSKGLVQLAGETGPEGTYLPGAWVTMADGRRVWLLTIRSPEAASLRIHFERFNVGTGRVWIHDGDPNGSQVFGPYESRGIWGDGDFWSDTVFGDRVTIEYLPADPGVRTVPFQVTEIAHRWNQLEAPPDASNTSPPDIFGPASADVFPKAGQSSSGPQLFRAYDWSLLEETGLPSQQQAAGCHLDVSCYQDWELQARSVAKIEVEGTGTTWSCSGTLLITRNATFEPYLLTSAHCVGNDKEARTVQAFWDYRTPHCNGSPPNESTVPRTRGARYVTGSGSQGDGPGPPNGDFSLLYLLGELPDDAVFSGWDPNPVEFGSSVVGIHHPKGDFKRISFGDIVPDTWNGLFESDVYAQVQWSRGRTEYGSSGSGVFMDGGYLVGILAFGPKVPAGKTVCDLEPLSDGYQRFSQAYSILAPYLEDEEKPPSQPIGIQLVPGVTESFTLPPVDRPSVFTQAPVYRVEAPDGLSRMTVRMKSSNPNTDVDMFLRYGSPVAVEGGTLQFDRSGLTEAGEEVISLTANTSPSLKAGTYFIALGLYSTGVSAPGTIWVEFTRPAPPPPPSGELLVSGQSVNFVLPSVSQPTLFSNSASYRIEVPTGATRLTVELRSSTPGTDVDLFLRYGEPPDIVNDELLVDAASTGYTGDETIVVTTSTSPKLRAGTYYIALGLYSTGHEARGTLKATVGEGGVPPPDAVNLTSGEPSSFSLPSVDGPTLFGDWRIDVPEGAPRLELHLVTSTAGVDVDLFARYGVRAEVQDGRVVADYRSEGMTGEETITITPQSSPPLRSGTYHVSLGLVTSGSHAEGTITATVEPTLAPAEVDPEISSVANAASFERRAIAPGELVSIFGDRLGPAEGIRPRLDATGRLPTSAEGVTVLIGGIPAPLMYLRADQINAQVPYGIAGRTSAEVEVLFEGRRSAPFAVSVAQCAPGLFTFPDGRALVFFPSGVLVSETDPAEPGDVVTFWATGEGPTTPAGIDGKPAAAPLGRPIGTVRMTIGGAEADIVWAGSAPYFVGLLQLNVRLPARADLGDRVPVTLKVGADASQPGVTMCIRAAAPVLAPTVELTAEPTTVERGGSATLRWSSTNATTARLSPAGIEVPVNGSRQVSPNQTTTYTITVTGPGGQASASATVTISDAPTVTLSAEPASISPGQSATLRWSSANATSASLSPGIGSVPVNGSRQVSPAQTTTYVITVSGPGGQASDSATVTVSGQPAEIFSPSPGSTLPGSTVTFRWTSGQGVAQYYLKVGGRVDGGDIYEGDQGTRMSREVSSIPTDGSTLYVRLSSRMGASWTHRDYTYTAFGAPTVPQSGTWIGQGEDFVLGFNVSGAGTRISTSGSGLREGAALIVATTCQSGGTLMSMRYTTIPITNGRFSYVDADSEGDRMEVRGQFVSPSRAQGNIVWLDSYESCPVNISGQWQASLDE